MKVRVSELAKKLGLPAPDLIVMLADFGDYDKRPSSTLEAPVVRKLRGLYPQAPNVPVRVANWTAGRRV